MTMPTRITCQAIVHHTEVLNEQDQLLGFARLAIEKQIGVPITDPLRKAPQEDSRQWYETDGAVSM